MSNIKYFLFVFCLFCLLLPYNLLAEDVFMNTNSSAKFILLKEKKKKFRLCATDEEVEAAWARIREKQAELYFSLEDFSAKMPSRYDDFIIQAAKRHKLDPLLIKAVIKVESDFNPKAISSKGAQGLMQIMPKNSRNWGIKDPFNPRESIFYGSWYLKKQLDEFKELKLALAAYNVGPTAVKKNVNNIFFNPEIKIYIFKVLGYYKALQNQ